MLYAPASIAACIRIQESDDTMNAAALAEHDPALDLTFERIVDVPREKIWAAWTQPDLLMPWFCPLPWKVVACEIDLRPGGRFRTVMRSPEGQDFPNDGCYLDIVENERLVWTNALGPGLRPARGPSVGDGMEFAFTAVIALAVHGNGTRYSARVIHGNDNDRRKHAAMGFEQGWAMALDQLVALIRANGPR